MNNNDILRRLRYTFDFNDDRMMELFRLGGYEATRAEISDWLKPEGDENRKPIYDKFLAAFLNGFITFKRGKKEGEDAPQPEKRLNNNQKLRKLKIALSYKNEDILEVLKLADFYFSKHELSALFRKPTQSQYRVCKDQVLRNFLYGLQLKYRPGEKE